MNNSPQTIYIKRATSRLVIDTLRHAIRDAISASGIKPASQPLLESRALETLYGIIYGLAHCTAHTHAGEGSAYAHIVLDSEGALHVTDTGTVTPGEPGCLSETWPALPVTRPGETLESDLLEGRIIIMPRYPEAERYRLFCQRR